MSNIYNLEPPTSGKVVLKTTLGEVDIELWPKEAPLASRNFVQLCLEGYYDNTIFHRVIRDFIVQGGDPTGTGTGGESIYGQPFKDEFHSRLRFSHRGLLACANQNEPHTNGSQFFLTLAAVESLNKKNTIFGKVVGDTIYNAMRLGEVDVDDNDRPLEPPKILSADVVFNPFEDIVPRMRAPAPAPEVPTGKKPSAGGRKNLTLLSFGEEAEEEEVVLTKAAKTRIRSAHDVLEDERLVGEAELPEEAKELLRAAQQRRPGELQRIRDKLAGDSADGPNRQQPAAPSTSDRAQEEGGEEGAPGAGADFAASMRAKMVSRRREMGDAPEPKRQRAEPPKPIEEPLPPARRRSPNQMGHGSSSTEEQEAKGRRS